MNIAVIGTGYVGLVTGTCLAETGNRVTCVDIDQAKVEKLKNGIIPIFEPGLQALFERNVQHNRLAFTIDLEEGIKEAEVVFLALPTPSDEDGSADLKHVIGVADQIGPLLEDYKVIVNKSTVPVGTAGKVTQRIAASTKVEFDVVSNPEFLREGVAVEDFMKPDRVVIGTRSARAKKIMETLFAPFVRQGNPVLFMDEHSAELTKYAANAFLATKITFMNEIANLCELLDADVDSVRKGIGTDLRIGKRFLFAGIGYGGSCFPKDVLALNKTSVDADYDFKILKSVMDVNEKQKVRMIDKIKSHFNGDLSGKTIAVWGLSFKPYTDDIREAPALVNIKALLNEGAKIRAYDPEAMDNVKNMFQEPIELCDDEYQAAQGADALLIATEWPEFRSPDFKQLQSLLKNNLIFDGRNVYDIEQMNSLGFTYYSIGRQQVNG